MFKRNSDFFSSDFPIFHAPFFVSLALLQVCLYISVCVCGHARVHEYGCVPERDSTDARVLHNTALLYTIISVIFSSTCARLDGEKQSGDFGAFQPFNWSFHCLCLRMRCEAGEARERNRERESEIAWAVNQFWFCEGICVSHFISINCYMLSILLVFLLIYYIVAIKILYKNWIVFF